MREYTKMSFTITPPDCGWMHGTIRLLNESINFRMSAVLGDDLDALINMVWSLLSEVEELDERYRWDIDDNRFPCSSFAINEEGSEVIWSVSKKDKSLVHLSIDAIYNSGLVADRHLSADIPFFDFASVVMSAIQDLITQCGLIAFKKNWDRPFPITPFLIVKAALMQTNLDKFDTELSFLKEPFYIPVIRRKIRKFTLITDNTCYGLCPEPDEVTRQRLTITNSGRIYVRSYTFSGAVTESTSFRIQADDAIDVIDDLTDYLNCHDTEVWETDSGTWELALTDEATGKYRFVGSICHDRTHFLGEFSRNLRRYLHKADLFAFDGRTGEKSDGIEFCSCEFYDGGRTYYYTTNDPSLEEGDLVRVPVGENGRVAVVRIVNIEYFEEDDLPMPFDEVKSIIEKVDEEDT